jgi:D-alanyl-D-alanine carboxypeptidase (penicillin-binding protein 5/6)
MEDPVFAGIVASPSATLPSERRAEGYFVQTTNDLLREGLVSGIKTGTTGEAGGCLISAIDVGENRVIAVILGSPVDGDNESPARYADTRLVLDALFREYRWFDPAEPGAVDGLADELSAWQTELPSGPAIVVPADRADELRYRLLLGPPGQPDEEVGKVLFYVGPDFLSERPVLQAADPALALDPKRVILLAA